MALTLRLEKESPLTYEELDNNFIYLNAQIVTLDDQISSLFRAPLTVGPCSDSTFVWPVGYIYYAKQACSSSFPWWTGSNGRGILASETYATTDATALGSLAFGWSNSATAINAFAHGVSSSAAGASSHAEGLNTRANLAGSHTEGNGTFAEIYGSYSHAEGYNTHVSHQYSHAEGENNYVFSRCAHAEGYQNYAGWNGILITSDEAKGAHAEGRTTVASGSYSHTEGWSTLTKAWAAHAEGYLTSASHSGSHAEGLGTSTGLFYQHATGRYNIFDNTDDFFVIGDGDAFMGRSNAFGVNATRTYLSNSIYLPDLSNSAQNFVLVYNTSSKQVFFTSSTAIGSGPSISILSQSATPPLTSNATSINFTGNGVTATAVGNAVTVNIPGTFSLPIRDEGTLLTNTPSQINFVGAGVSASVIGNAVTVTVPSLTIRDEGNLVTSSLSILNFTGSGVSASRGAAGTVNVFIPSLNIRDEGNLVTSSLVALNFTGSGVSASLGANGIVNVYVPQGTAQSAAGPAGAVQLSDGFGNFIYDRLLYNQATGYLDIVSLYQQGSLRISPKRVNIPGTYNLLIDDYALFIDSSGGNITIDFIGGTFNILQGSTLKFIMVNGGGTSVAFANAAVQGVSLYNNPTFTNPYETLTIIYNNSAWWIVDSYNSSII